MVFYVILSYIDVHLHPLLSLMLEQEFAYYLNHQDELVKKYNGKYLIIKDQKVEAAYDKKEDAYFEGQKKYDLGTFLIQYCAPGNMSFTQTFYSLNVSF